MLRKWPTFTEGMQTVSSGRTPFFNLFQFLFSSQKQYDLAVKAYIQTIGTVEASYVVLKVFIF